MLDFRSLSGRTLCGMLTLAVLAAITSPAEGGTIQGVVKFEGRRAARAPIRMEADQYCVGYYRDKDAPAREMFVFGSEFEDGSAALVNVLVYVSKGLEGQSFETPADAAEVDQHGCMYLPHVLALQAGQPLHILNSDNTLHNVKMTSSRNGAFNESMPVKGMVLEKRLDRPEMAVNLKCDVHPWMGAYLHVFEHPYFAVTGEDGSFTIEGLPAGEYEITVWHEFDRFTPTAAAITVNVAEDETSEANFTYQPPSRN